MDDVGGKPKYQKDFKRRGLFKGLSLFRQHVSEKSFDQSASSGDERDKRSKSALDVRDMDLPSPDAQSSLTLSSSGKKRKFFSSFRSKARKLKHGKVKDKNENLQRLTSSQPNINSSLTSTDNDEPDSNYRPVLQNDQNVTPPRSRSQSHGHSLHHTSSEEWDRAEVDSGIAVIDSPTSVRVGY